MIKTKNIIVIILFLVLIGGIVLCLSLNTFNDNKSQKSFYWVPKESFFAGYEIVNENTVRFKYSICFINETESDIAISLSAKFKRKELKNWIKQNGFFVGYDEKMLPLCSVIKSGEKNNVIVVFEGEYLGGKVNEELGFPEELLLMNTIS